MIFLIMMIKVMAGELQQDNNPQWQIKMIF